MKKYLTYVFLMILGGLIAYIILGDIFTNNLKKTNKNPYAYSLGNITSIDPALIKYKEVKRIALNIVEPVGIAYQAGRLVIAYKNHIQAIDTAGFEFFNKSLSGQISCIALASTGNIYIGFTDHLEVLDSEGNLLKKWEALDTNTYITSIALKSNTVFVADAGNKRVIRYNDQGELQLTFDGTGRLEVDYGFIIPSPYFDLAIDPDDQLWVANTGIQNLENYSDDGALRSFWGESGLTLEGFSGCCNPAHFCILSNGSFVTCEKGLVRVKVYFPSGELDGFVASSKSFDENADPADLTSDEEDRIYVLDKTGKMIRKFERKTI